MELEESTFLTSDYTTKVQQSDSMVMAEKKQKYRPVEQDRKPRDKPMHLWASYLWQTRQEYTIEDNRLSLQQVVLEKLDSYM